MTGLDPHSSLRTESGTARSGAVIHADGSDPNAGRPVPARELTKAEKALHARIANAPARKAATAARLAGIAARKVTGFRVGDKVRTNTPRSPRFHQREGTVLANHLGEVGVTFVVATPIRTTELDKVDAWFLPAELSKIRPAQGGHQ